jgi:hypothetical protein
MPASRVPIGPTNPSMVLKWLGRCLVLALATLSCGPRCRAQNASPCRDSTVEDAWGPTVASEARAFLATLQRVVKAGDKKQFAKLIHYPVRVFEDGGRSVEITSRSDLVKKYSSILTPAVRHAILTQSAACLFGNGQGMMIGNGQVWFQKEPDGNMKIITINLPAPKVGD